MTSDQLSVRRNPHWLRGEPLPPIPLDSIVQDGLHRLLLLLGQLAKQLMSPRADTDVGSAISLSKAYRLWDFLFTYLSFTNRRDWIRGWAIPGGLASPLSIGLRLPYAATSQHHPLKLVQVGRAPEEPLFTSLREQYHSRSDEQAAGEHLKCRAKVDGRDTWNHSVTLAQKQV